MINFEENFLLKLALNELGAGQKNEIRLVNNNCEFPTSKKMPTLPFKMTANYKALYEQIESATFVWNLDTEDERTRQVILSTRAAQELISVNLYDETYFLEQIGGELIIPSAGSIGEDNHKYGYIFSLETSTRESGTYILIDIGSEHASLLKITDGTIVDNVFLFAENLAEMFDMNLNLEEYFELAFKCKCFKNWQLAYVLGEESDAHKMLKAFVPLIFPIENLDLSAWKL